eukprot:1137299-Pelagomonas_calceolata.AAC.1
MAQWVYESVVKQTEAAKLEQVGKPAPTKQGDYHMMIVCSCKLQIIHHCEPMKSGEAFPPGLKALDAKTFPFP